MKSDPRRTIYLLRQAGLAFRHAIDSFGEEVGVTLSQHTVLSHLTSTSVITAADLARRLEISPQSVNEIVSSLQASGLVAKQAVATNRKSLQLVLTSQGRAHLERAEQAIDRPKTPSWPASPPGGRKTCAPPSVTSSNRVGPSGADEIVDGRNKISGSRFSKAA